MNEGHYISIRNYLEEIASQNKQLLAEQKRTNELMERGMSATAIGKVVEMRMTELLEGIDKPAAAQGQKAAATSGAVKPSIPADAVGPVTVETVETVETAVRPPALDPSATTPSRLQRRDRG